MNSALIFFNSKKITQKKFSVIYEKNDHRLDSFLNYLSVCTRGGSLSKNTSTTFSEKGKEYSFPVISK